MINEEIKTKINQAHSIFSQPRLFQLERENFQRAAAKILLEAANSARASAASPIDYTPKIEAIGKHLFGELWTGVKPE